MTRYCVLYVCTTFFLLQCSRAPSETETSAPLFVAVLPEHSGIRFMNTIKENPVINYHNTKYIYNGAGVAIGDINNDGLPDIYFSSNIYSNKLYLNKGNLQFEDISRSADVESSRGFKSGVAMVDLNGDGWLDIFVCRTSHPDPALRNNLVYINNQDGTFTERAAEMGLHDQSYTNQAVFFDYDNDGDLDIYLVNHPIDFDQAIRVRTRLDEQGRRIRKISPDEQYVSDQLYRNNGDGTFTDVSAEAGIRNQTFGLSAAVIDVNNDGYPDIFVANDFIEPDMLYVNNGDGTFTEAFAEYFRHTSHNSMGSDAADFNNDGLEDLIVLDMLPEDNKRQKLLATSMVLERYNALVQYGYQHQLMRNVLQLNNGNGSFSDIGELAGVAKTDWSWAALFADFDNDGWKDIFIGNGIKHDMTNMDYLDFKTDSLQKAAAAGRPLITEQNYLDWINFMPSNKLRNYMYRNTQDLRFADVSDAWGLTEKLFSNGAAYADLDNDGDLDLVLNNLDDTAAIYENKSNELRPHDYLKINFEGPSPNRFGVGAAARVYAQGTTQVHQLKVARGFLSSMPMELHFGLGEAKQADSIRILWPDGRSELLQNVPANQTLTAAYANAHAGRWTEPVAAAPIFEALANSIDFQHIEDDFNDFKREPLLPHQLSQLGPFLATGDVNGDGLDDCYIGGASGQAGVLFLQQADGQWRPQAFAEDAACEDMGALFFDADGDGDLDLYVVSGGYAFADQDERYRDRLYLNDGKGNFAKASDRLPDFRSNGSVVVAADFDQDGDLDLFIGGRALPDAYPMAPRSYLLQNDKGYFKDVTTSLSKDLLQPGLVTDALWLDLDRDGYADLILVGEWMPITIFKNEGGKRFSNQTRAYGLAQTAGWWNTLRAADLNGDGHPDLIAGNLGWNSLLRATPEQPLTIHAADFDGNGSIEGIICNYVQGQSWPLPRKEVLDKILPLIKRRFIRFEDYAVARIEDFFPKEQLRKAQYLETHTLASAVFLNDGKGRFSMQPLPVMAQLAPVNGLLAEDFNGDGILDILLVGNRHHCEVEIGRMDAGNGLLLLGNGDGTFRSVWSRHSGFLAAGDAKDLRMLRAANGRRLIIVTNNNGPVQVWQQN